MQNKGFEFPKVLRIEPSPQCNLRCSHCPTGTVEMSRSKMPREIFEKIMIDIKDYREHIKVIVLYHGGKSN